MPLRRFFVKEYKIPFLDLIPDYQTQHKLVRPFPNFFAEYKCLSKLSHQFPTKLCHPVLYQLLTLTFSDTFT